MKTFAETPGTGTVVEVRDGPGMPFEPLPKAWRGKASEVAARDLDRDKITAERLAEIEREKPKPEPEPDPGDAMEPVAPDPEPVAEPSIPGPEPVTRARGTRKKGRTPRARPPGQS